MQELHKLWLRETGEKEESSKCFKEQSLWEKKVQHSGAKILVKRMRMMMAISSTLVFVCCQLEKKHFNLGGDIFAKNHIRMNVPICKPSMEKMEKHSDRVHLSLSHVANLLHLLRRTVWCILKLEGSCCCGILSIFHESYITTAGTKSISNLWVSLFQTHKKLLQLVQSQSLICSDLHKLFWPHKHFIPMAFAFWVEIHLWNHLSPRRRNMWRKLLHPHLLCRWAILITAFIIEESCATLFITPKP